MHTAPDPTPIIELATAYWGSATLIAAARLKIFTHLAAGAADPATLAARAEVDADAVEGLLAGLVSLNLVQKNADGTFANTPSASTFLVEGSPAYLGPAMLYNGDVYPLWARLDEVIRTGKVTEAPDQYLGDDDSRTRNFVYGMHHRALGVGQALTPVVDLSGRTRLADVGGGPGTYSALLTQKTEGLTSEVLDLPGVVAIAKEIVASLGASERVQCTAFDYYKDNLPGRYDAALISGVLHREHPPQVQAIFQKVADAMDPGGVLYISDVMVNDDRTGPLFSTMFELNMRVLSHGGRCHSVAEQRAWLDAVGFEITEVVTLPPPIHYTVIRAERRS
ncbi:MAG: methyltransferase [Bradymonadia bacterium]